MGVSIYKLLELIKTILVQLVCPWQASLHSGVAYLGYFLYFLLSLWLLSFYVKAIATFLNHFLYIIALIGTTIEIYIAKLLEDPFLVNKHKAEQRFMIKNFRSHCTLSKILFRLKDFFK